MSRRSEGSSSLDQKSWFKSTQAVVGLAAGVVALVTALLKLTGSGWFHTEPSGENIEIVIDASEGMRAAFDGKTKLDALKASLQTVLNKHTVGDDKFALRRYGGECNGDNNTALLVDFGRKNQNKIRAALEKLNLEGQAPLATGVVNASADLATAKGNRRIIVIAGDGGCEKDPQKLIRDRLQTNNANANKNIIVDFHFIYLGESAAEFRKLEALATETHGEAYAAENEAQLDAALFRPIEISPVLGDIKHSTEILNAVIDRTNESLEALNRKDYAASEQSLTAARSEFERTAPLFEDFRKRQGEQTFRDAQRIASENRDIQGKILDLWQPMIEHAKRNEDEEFNKSLDAFAPLREAYNANVGKLDQTARTIEQETAKKIKSLRSPNKSGGGQPR